MNLRNLGLRPPIPWTFGPVQAFDFGTRIGVAYQRRRLGRLVRQAVLLPPMHVKTIRWRHVKQAREAQRAWFPWLRRVQPHRPARPLPLMRRNWRPTPPPLPPIVYEDEE